MITTEKTDLDSLQHEILFWQQQAEIHSKKIIEKDATIFCLEEQLSKGITTYLLFSTPTGKTALVITSLI